MHNWPKTNGTNNMHNRLDFEILNSQTIPLITLNFSPKTTTEKKLLGIKKSRELFCTKVDHTNNTTGSWATLQLITETFNLLVMIAFSIYDSEDDGICCDYRILFFKTMSNYCFLKFHRPETTKFSIIHLLQMNSKVKVPFICILVPYL
jgi:hypothetical protein